MARSRANKSGATAVEVGNYDDIADRCPDHPMGDPHRTAFRPLHNGSIRVEGRPERLTAHAGVLLLRELDERLGATSALESALDDLRTPTRVEHPLGLLLRTAIYGMAIDSAHAAAAADLADDAVFRIATSDRRGLSMLEEDAATPSQSTLSRLGSLLSTDGNLSVLRGALFDWAVRSVRATGPERLDEVTLDIDSYPIRVHGHQAGSAYNGHYRSRCYHPLGVMLGETGHWLDLRLRPGNEHTADGAEELIAPLIDRARAELSDAVRVRGDAGFISPEFLDLLDGKQVPYALRIPKNSELEKHEEIHARRPPGRPPAYLRTWCHDIEYRALRWPEARRVVLVVEEVPGDLFLKTYFIVTSFTEDELCARDVLDFYRARGTMEGHIGEMKSVLAGRLSSTNRRKRRYARREIKKHVKPVDPERVNAAVLCVQALGYNLLNTFRSLAGTSAFIDEPAELHLRRARALLVVPGRIVRSAGRATLVIRDVALAAWQSVVERLRQLRPPCAVA